MKAPKRAKDLIGDDASFILGFTSDMLSNDLTGLVELILSRRVKS